MRCPFRTNTEFDYEELRGTKEKEFLPRVHRQEYAECYEDECPYYNVYMGCDLVKATIGEED